MGHPVAWILLALVNSLVISTIPVFAGGLGTRVLQHVYGLGQMLAVGLLLWLVVCGWHRFGPKRRAFGYAAIALVAALASQWELYRDLLKGAGAMAPPGYEVSGVRALAVVVSLGMPATVWAATFLSRSRVRRYLVIVAALAVAFAHQRVLPNLYPGLHAYVTWSAAVALGCALGEPAGRAVERWSSRVRRVAVGSTASFAVLSYVIMPSSAVLSTLLMIPGAVMAPIAARLPDLWLGPHPDALNESWEPWLKPRDGAPDVPPGGPRVLPDDAIIFLIVLDAFRADLLEEPHLSKLPNLSRLRAEAVHFRNAWTTSPNTNWTMTSVFSGKYANQLLWENKRFQTKTRTKWEKFPHLDKTLRFPHLLERKNIHSIVSTHLDGLKRKYGLTRGFTAELPVLDRSARGVMNGALRWLKKVPGGESWLFYLHLIDTHAPYNLGGTQGTPFERYVLEAQFVDRQLGRLFRHARAKLAGRVVFIVTADHGEAFGEHNSAQHGSTVYQEVARVPLLIHGAPFEPRQVEAHVSLIDLAPTVLDLHGIASPGAFMGQSLRGLLMGKDIALDRPIYVDSLSRDSSLLFPDGIRLVHRARGGLIELYDTLSDPKELKNVADTLPGAPERRALYKKFVRVHELYEK